MFCGNTALFPAKLATLQHALDCGAGAIGEPGKIGYGIAWLLLSGLGGYDPKDRIQLGVDLLKRDHGSKVVVLLNNESDLSS